MELLRNRRKERSRDTISFKAEKPQTQNYKTLGAFAKILHLLNDPEVEELSVTEISKVLGMVSSKASRMLASLEREGLFHRNKDTGKYRLGIIFLSLGTNFASHFPLRKVVRPHLEQMAREKMMTASFAIFAGDKVITVDRIENMNIDLVAHRIGLDLPVHSTSVGKVLLAYRTEEEQDRILTEKKLTKFTERTVVDPRKIKAMIRECKIRGYATDEGETHEDLNCIATPIKNSSGEVVAALNLMAECSRISAEELFKNARYLKDRSLFISRQLGFKY